MTAPPAGPERPAPGRQLLDTRIVAIFRAPGPKRIEAVAEVLVEHGVSCLEISLTTPGAVVAISALRRRLGADASVGAGTVIGVDALASVLDAGAEFIVTPVVQPEVIGACAAGGIPCYPGAFSATEVLGAWEAGATAVKVFPAGLLGPAYIKALRDPLPAIPLVPTGGVALDAIPAYLDAGSLAVGLGSPLLGDALGGGDLEALARRAGEAIGVVQDWQRRHA
jgi:2-dehydro-3-deoxyphosphogluconate aldolase/(4S)-4-hydroxy-2-oxoglutarate aldolase